MGAPHGNTNGVKHGLYRTPEYTAWCSMLARCRRPTHRYYKDYGGRGITVCDRWQSFEAFYEDMGPRPAPGLSIERIDNARGYEPGNCKWATPAEQGANLRKNRIVEIDGETMHLAEAARRCGLKINTVAQRLHKGWSLERALSEPVNKSHDHRSK